MKIYYYYNYYYFDIVLFCYLCCSCVSIYLCWLRKQYFCRGAKTPINKYRIKLLLLLLLLFVTYFMEGICNCVKYVPMVYNVESTSIVGLQNYNFWYCM